MEVKAKNNTHITVSTRHPDDDVFVEGYSSTLCVVAETDGDGTIFQDIHLTTEQLRGLSAQCHLALDFMDSSQTVASEHDRVEAAILDLSSSGYLYGLRDDKSWLSKVHFALLTKYNDLSTLERVRVIVEVLTRWAPDDCDLPNI